MLTITPTGVRYQNPTTPHYVRRPSRAEAQDALTTVSEYLEAMGSLNYEVAQKLRHARDTLAKVVATAY
jgi:hypothetical protein